MIMLDWIDKHKPLPTHVTTTCMYDILAAMNFSYVDGGIGCMCTEFLFNIDTDRLDFMRLILLENNIEIRKKYLYKL